LEFQKTSAFPADFPASRAAAEQHGSAGTACRKFGLIGSYRFDNDMF
jgi:hypothetical protein